MNKMITKEIQSMLGTVDFLSMEQEKPVTKEDLHALPRPVQRWMEASGMLGKPMIHAAYVQQKANMKMKPEQEDWKYAEAQQYVTMEEPAFIWTGKMKMGSLISIRGRDKFVDGKGEMLIRMNSLINVVNEKGPRMDEGTLQRYLGELVWFPSLALSPYITWEAIDDTSAKATMHYMGTTGSGTFYYDEQGDFIRFVALRYMENKDDAIRYPWVLTVDAYAEFEGIRIPSEMKATWKLEENDWTWLELQLVDVQYNVSQLVE